MAAVVGVALIEILPDTSRFARDLSRHMGRMGREHGANFSRSFGRSFHSESGRQGDQAGRSFSRAFGRSLSDQGRGSAPWALQQMAQAFVLLGPAALPTLAAIGGAAASMGAAVASAGGAFAVFGLAAKSQLSPVFEGFKQLTSARERYKKATTQAGRDAALADQKRILAEMTPIQRQVVAGMDSLVASWKRFGRTANRPILEAFMSGMRAAQNLLRKFEPVVRPVALVVRKLVGEFEAFTRGPALNGLVNWLATTGPRAIQVFVYAARDIAVGLGHLGLDFIKTTNSGQGFLGWLAAASARFRQWATTTPAVSQFMAAASKSLPLVAEALKAVGFAAGQIILALGPLGGVVLRSITLLAQAIGWVADKMPWLIQAMWFAYAASRAYALVTGVLTAAQTLYASRMALATAATRAWAIASTAAAWAGRALGVAMTIALGPIGWIIAAVVAIGVALVVAYQKVGWFRTAVDASVRALAVAWRWLLDSVIRPVMNGIGAAVSWAYHTLIRPALSGIGAAVRWLGGAFSWLLHNIVRPLFTWVGAHIRWVWTTLIQPSFNAIMTALRWLAGGFNWFLNNIVRPLFTWVGAHIRWVWTTLVQPAFNAMMTALRWLANGFAWFLHNIVRPLFTWVGAHIRWVWQTIIQPAFNGFMNGLRWLAAGFNWFLHNIVRPLFT